MSFNSDFNAAIQSAGAKAQADLISSNKAKEKQKAKEAEVVTLLEDDLFTSGGGDKLNLAIDVAVNDPETFNKAGEAVKAEAEAKMAIERKDSVSSVYRDVLGREPDPEGLQHFIDSGLSVDEIKSAISGSPEAQAKKEADAAEAKEEETLSVFSQNIMEDGALFDDAVSLMVDDPEATMAIADQATQDLELANEIVDTNVFTADGADLFDDAITLAIENPTAFETATLEKAEETREAEKEEQQRIENVSEELEALLSTDLFVENSSNFTHAVNLIVENPDIAQEVGDTLQHQTDIIESGLEESLFTEAGAGLLNPVLDIASSNPTLFNTVANDMEPAPKEDEGGGGFLGTGFGPSLGEITDWGESAWNLNIINNPEAQFNMASNISDSLLDSGSEIIDESGNFFNDPLGTINELNHTITLEAPLGVITSALDPLEEDADTFVTPFRHTLNFSEDTAGATTDAISETLGSIPVVGEPLANVFDAEVAKQEWGYNFFVGDTLHMIVDEDNSIYERLFGTGMVALEFTGLGAIDNLAVGAFRGIRRWGDDLIEGGLRFFGRNSDEVIEAGVHHGDEVLEAVVNNTDTVINAGDNGIDPELIGQVIDTPDGPIRVVQAPDGTGQAIPSSQTAEEFLNTASLDAQNAIIDTPVIVDDITEEVGTVPSTMLPQNNTSAWADELSTEFADSVEAGTAEIDNLFNEFGSVTGRPKGPDSIQTKLDNKIDDNIDINNIDDARAAIGDGIGTRLILSDPTDVQKFVDELADSIIDGDLTITSFSNYSYVGPDGAALPYLDNAQVAQVQQALHTAYNNPQSSLRHYFDANDIDIDTVILTGQDANKPSGYTTTQMNVIHGDGTIGELQIRGAAIDEFAEIEHIIYDLKQGKDADPIFDEIRDARVALKGDELEPIYDQYIRDYYEFARRTELGENVARPDFPQALQNSGFEALDIDHVSDVHAEFIRLKAEG